MRRLRKGHKDGSTEGQKYGSTEVRGGDRRGLAEDCGGLRRIARIAEDVGGGSKKR